MAKSHQKMANYINHKTTRTVMKAENKIYQAFLEIKESKLYFNQIKEYTGLSNSSTQNILKVLIENNIIKQIKTKSNTFYEIKDKKYFALKFSELAYNRFNNLNVGVRVPLKNFLEKIPKDIYTVVVFGSASRKEEQEGSDVDILIVSDKKVNLEQNKKEAEATSSYPISIFNCTIEQFVDNKDHMIIQARKTGFAIHKEQNYYEAVLDEY